jgi:hypothetical protein
MTTDNDTHLDPNYSYPPALVKQIAKTEQYYGEYDVYIVINHLNVHKLWFQVIVTIFYIDFAAKKVTLEESGFRRVDHLGTGGH